ncbi:MAG: hypothetical protein ING90_00315 [Rhodocyclaceae bacterium]|nr:hypothetical protein [Rhodocyclaceae bacterium]MCA3136273.1 hypothetical protein [Rhodocyclaceae bacterium]
MTRVDRLIARLLVVLLAVLPVVHPVGEARAAGGQFNPRWTSAPVSSTVTVRYPLDNWSLLGEIAGRGGGGFDLRMLQGERWITAAREEVGQLGLGSDVVSKLVMAFPGHAAMVFATYSPENAQLRIRVVKAERQADGRIRSYLGDFTPHHGERWAAQRHYLSPAEAADPIRAGRNPFAVFRPTDETDPVFHNIGWSAAQVAVGHAMRLYNAPAGFIAMTDTRWTQVVTRSGNLLRQRVDTTTQAWVRPRWFVALPVDQQPYGVQAAICTLPGSTSCPTVEQLAQSGVSVSQWEGGNMPSPEDLLYSWTDSRSGFTVLAFALVTAAFVWVAASAVTAYASASSLAGQVGTSFLSPGWASAFAGGSYAVSSTVAGGGGPITSAQESFLGATGSGFLERPRPSDRHAAGLADVTSTRHVHQDIAAGLAGVRLLFEGDCARTRTTDDCSRSTVNVGRIPRPDATSFQNNVVEIRQRYAQCAAKGLRGSDLRACAARMH